MPKVSVLNELL